MTAAVAMVPYDPKAAVFWSNLVEAAYSTFYNNPGNPNPQPPAFPRLPSKAMIRTFSPAC